MFPPRDSTALVAAARLGSRAAFAGVLGDDELSQFAFNRFREERIDTQYVRRRAEARPIHSVIVVDESTKTRTILYDLEGAFGAEPDWPDEEVIGAARVVFGSPMTRLVLEAAGMALALFALFGLLTLIVRRLPRRSLARSRSAPPIRLLACWRIPSMCITISTVGKLGAGCLKH